MSSKSSQSAGVWNTFAQSPLAVKAVLAGVFVNKLGGFLNIFLVLFMTAQGYSGGQAATALGVYGGGSVIGVLIGGALADWLGARNSTVLSMGGSAVLIAALLYLPNYLLLIVVVALVGTVSQLYRPASATLLAEQTSEERQVMIFAMYRFGLNLGTTAAPLLGFWLYNLDNQQYTLVFLGEALVALVYAVLAFYALPRRVAKKAQADSPAAEKSSYLEVLKDRRFVLFLIANLFVGVVYIQYLATLPLDVSAAGVPIFWYTLAIALNGFIVIAIELPVTKVTQKWPFKLTAVLGWLLLAAGIAVYGLPLGPAVILIGTMLWTLGEIVGGPAVFSYPGTAGPAHLRSRYIGSFQFMYGLGTAIGPIIGGALYFQLGHGLWPVMAVFALLAAALGLVGFTKPVKPTGHEPAEEAKHESLAPEVGSDA
ncbi:MFS family permease [Kibdelosporangium banguiense]|uniref:MFS family permease n=1 Tax=Kibdelosporangium banguiense TaxID=1365924 RepID=A0ABS4TRC9_9PSEU|nr:MFS transporter [Kibdelosporangium banguiense]MBP2326468.1 MFS family permease [Kibdelosporangium banguiense]